MLNYKIQLRGAFFVYIYKMFRLTNVNLAGTRTNYDNLHFFISYLIIFQFPTETSSITFKNMLTDNKQTTAQAISSNINMVAISNKVEIISYQVSLYIYSVH